jgi:uncharacterized membrane protein
MTETRHIASTPILFEAVVTPHRSLSPFGRRLVLAAMTGLAGLIALLFLLIGAWPVIGFSVIEIGLIWLMFHLNQRAAHARELVLLDSNRLRVVRTDPSGLSREQVLPAAWLKVRLEEERGRIPRLLIYTHTACEEIGAALGEAEKRNLATALCNALHDARNPQFDNPQLRD